MKLSRFGFISVILLSLASRSIFASDLDFALELAKDGYTDLADKFLQKINKNELLKDPAKYQKTMYEIKMAQFRLEKDKIKKTQLLKDAKGHFQQTNPTPLESANNKFQTANLIALDLRDFSTTADEKKEIRDTIIPLYAEARDDFKTVATSLKDAYDEFMDKVMSDPGYQKSLEFKKKVEDIWTPFVVSYMRYFECIVERAELIPSGDPNRILNMEKYIEEAEDFTYICEAPVPVANVYVYAARMHSILSLSGKESKTNNEKALAKFQEVLNINSTNASDAALILGVQAEACRGKMDMAMKLNDYKEAVASLEYYLSKVRKSHRVTPKEFDIMLGGLLSYSHWLQTTGEKRLENNIENLRVLIERCARESGNTEYWNRKLVDYLVQKDLILGKETEDPAVLIQLANGQQRDEKFENAVGLYRKALSKKFSNADAIKLKPSTYYSAAFCAYRAGNFAVGVELMKAFFAEFPPTDSKYASLKDQYEKSARLFNIVASKEFENKQDDASKSDVLRSLDYLESITPELALFKKVDLLEKSGNFIDAIKMLNEIKPTSIDYDKALFLKGLCLFKYSKKEKDDNVGIHSDLSKSLAQECKETFEAYLKYIKEDKSDIVQAKKELRDTWSRDAKKLLAFTLVSLELFDESVSLFVELIGVYEKDKDASAPGNLFFVTTGLISSYANAYEKEENDAKKDDLLSKQDALTKKLEALPSDVFSRTSNAEEKKKEVVGNYYLRLGIKMLASKNDAIKKRGLGLIELHGGKIENFNLFIARKLFEGEDYRSAAGKFKETLAEYTQKGYNVPLDEKDFDPIRKGFVNDKDISLFMNFFYYFAVNRNNAVTRDFGRLRRHISYILDPMLLPENETDEDRNIRVQLQEAASRHDWSKLVESRKFEELDLRLKEFLTYLGIVDDLAACYLHLNEFEEAIKHLEVLRKFYPGIFAEDLKLGNLKYEYARFLMSENKNPETTLKMVNDALDLLEELRKRLGRNTENKIYQELDQKRLICLTWRYILKSDKGDLERVHTALQIMYSNQEKYWEYKRLLGVLENSNNLPNELKPLTPEEVRKRDMETEEKVATEIKRSGELRREQEELEKKKRENQTVISDPSFVDWELRDVGESVVALYKNYLEQIEGVKIVFTADMPSYVVIQNTLNRLIRDPDLSKKIPADHFSGKTEAQACLTEIENLLKTKGRSNVTTDPKFGYMNRLLLEIAFPKLPKYKTGGK